MKAIEIRDFLQFQFLSALQYAPGGKTAAFVVAQCDEEENAYQSRLWLWDGEKARQLTDLGEERSFLWEDETHILFPAVRSKAEKKRAEKKDPFTSYYRLDITGGEATPAFTLPFRVNKLLPLKNGTYAVLAAVDATCPDYYAMTEEQKAEERKKWEEDRDYEVLDEMPFWGNGRGFTNKQRQNLFLFEPKSGDIRRMTQPLFQVGGIAELGEKLYFTGDLFRTKSSWQSHLYAVDLPTGTVEEVITDPEIHIQAIQAAGEKLWVTASEQKRYGLNENGQFYMLEGKSLRLVLAQEYSLHGSVGSDCRYGGGQGMDALGEELYYLTTREGDCHLYRVGPDGTTAAVVTYPGSIDCFALCEENPVTLMIAMYDGKLQELYGFDRNTGKLEKLTGFNDGAFADKYVSDYHPVTVKSAGLDIGGWVLLPKDYDPSKTYPAVLDIHGGPKTAFGPVYYHEMQVWAGMGYFVFFCNPKGSDGRDNAFADIRGHYGDTDYQNIMDFTDAVLKTYPQIDPKRVCVTGGSYGGFMTNWIIGHTDRFCCAATQRSISNWVSFWGVADIGVRFGQDQTAGDPYTRMETLWEQSPLKYAANVTTPTLFIHSDEDYRCPLPEGLQLYTALVDRGIEARFCLFHGENHELSRSGKPKHRIRRLTEITNWFEGHAK